MRIYTLKEWQENSIKQTSSDKDLTCPDCDGEGVAECSCCGNETTCDRCIETGRLKFKFFTDKERQSHFNKSRYIAALTKDLTDLAAWVGKDRLEVFIDCGLTVYSSVSSKREIVEA